MLKHAERRGRRFLNPVPTRVGGLGMMFRVLPLYLTNKEERVPREPLGPFRTDPGIYAQPPATGLRITWMGHSILLVEIDGLRVLIDPVWDERASPVRWGGPRRFYPAPLALSELPELDIVLTSHDHYDHLGKGTVQALSRLPAARNARWVTSLGVGRILRQFGVQAASIDELDWTDEITVRCHRTEAQITVTALPARHFSGRTLGSRFATLWSSFALRGTKHNLYYSADSGYWDGFVEIGEQYGPFDLSMLDTGAYNELWKQIHMGPDGARRTFEAICQSSGSSGLLMPVHWALFDLSLHAWRWPIERMTLLADRAGIKLWSPVPGLPTDLHKGVDLRSRWWVRQ